jgi:hypothetical protein
MEIKQIIKYKAGNLEFDSQEDAQAFIDKTSEDKEVYSRNYKLLNEITHKYAPSINKDGELCLWVNRFNNFDQGQGWENILGREHLRYVKEDIKLISSEDFIWEFISKAEEIHIEVNDMKEVISAIQLHFGVYFGSPRSIGEKEEFIYSNLLDALGKIHYSPVYIHD